MPNVDPIILLKDIWPDEIPAVEYPRVVRIISRLLATPQPREALATRRPAPKPAKRASGGRKPGRPPRGTPPLREEVKEFLQQHGPSTVAELEEAIKSPKASIYMAVRDIGAEPTGEGKYALPS